MRIFEKISRRLAITLAGVMACTSFAVAPALTAYAAGTGSWDDVVKAFVDGWASEYAASH